MTPQEKKAKELVEKYYSDKCFNGNYGEDYNAKECALICVDEILEATKKRNLRFKPNTVDTVIKYDTYWQEVKQEIIKL